MSKLLRLLGFNIHYNSSPGYMHNTFRVFTSLSFFHMSPIIFCITRFGKVWTPFFTYMFNFPNFFRLILFRFLLMLRCVILVYFLYNVNHTNIQSVNKNLISHSCNFLSSILFFYPSPVLVTLIFFNFFKV